MRAPLPGLKALAILAPLLLLAAPGQAGAERMARIRLLSGDAPPVAWLPGEPWPRRPADFPLAPSALLSYATFGPGDELSSGEFESRARAWERALAESGRFSKSAVYLLPLGDAEGGQLGAIIEAEGASLPLFGGGRAYAAVSLPLVGGRRTCLALEAGVDRASASYRDDALRDLPLVLDAGASYQNDLLSGGGLFSGRASAYAGIGPRLGGLGSLLARARLGRDLGGGAPAFAAAELVLELGGLELLGVRGLDGGLSAVASAYPGGAALRLAALSRLALERGAARLEAQAGYGGSRGALEPMELFDLGPEGALLRGPEARGDSEPGYALARIELAFLGLRARAASWLALEAGPFGFAEAVLLPAGAAPRGSRPLLGAGGGLRLRAGPPVAVTADLGWALGSGGGGELIVSVTSRKIL